MLWTLLRIHFQNSKVICTNFKRIWRVTWLLWDAKDIYPGTVGLRFFEWRLTKWSRDFWHTAQRIYSIPESNWPFLFVLKTERNANKVPPNWISSKTFSPTTPLSIGIAKEICITLHEMKIRTLRTGKAMKRNFGFD